MVDHSISVWRKRVLGAFLGFVLAAAVMASLTLVSPWVLGWRPASEKEAVLQTALFGSQPSRSAIKLVPASDLPSSLAWSAGSRLQGNVWVVAESGPPPLLHGGPYPPPTKLPSPAGSSAEWSVQAFQVGTGYGVSGTGGLTGSWPPFFDRLPDRSPPGWWPIPVPTGEVTLRIALVVVVLIALAFIYGLLRAIRFAFSRGTRKLGRPT